MEGLNPKASRADTLAILLAALVDAEFLMRQAGKYAGPMQDSFNRSAADARDAIDAARAAQTE